MNNSLLRLMVAASLLTLLCQSVWGDVGVVVQKEDGCDYFLAKVNEDYAILEWNAGHQPKPGDRLQGKFAEGYMGHLEDLRTGAKLKVWYENYPVSKEDASRLYAASIKSSCR